jgi:hypothetical protein
MKLIGDGHKEYCQSNQQKNFLKTTFKEIGALFFWEISSRHLEKFIFLFLAGNCETDRFNVLGMF